MWSEMHRIQNRIAFSIIFFWLIFPAAAFAQDRVLIFAAASMRDVMLELGKRFEEICACEMKFSFAATSTLARQIAVGAPADVFVSANKAWIKWLAARGGLKLDNAQEIAGNRLVIASNAKTKDSFNILWRGRFAMADPENVPAGIYAKQALNAMGIWERVQPTAIYSSNVRVALASVARGDVLSSIVYRSDLVSEPELHAHYIFPSDTHEPILYLALPVSQSGKAKGFLGFLTGADAQDLFFKFGFDPVSATQAQ